MLRWLSSFFGRNDSEEDYDDDEFIQPKQDIPEFKYHPYPLKTLTFEQEDSVTCKCCNMPTLVYYTYPFESSLDSVDYDDFFICPTCIIDGKASEKFQGKFQEPEYCEPVSSPEKLDELCHRTPGYYAPEKAYWLAHCDDFCALVDLIDDWCEIEEKGIEREIEEDWVINDNYDITDIAVIKEHLNFDNGGAFNGYLFRCLHCGKHRLYVDCDTTD
jgi:uncharacterized protein CbrC (UPF0167 family)